MEKEELEKKIKNNKTVWYAAINYNRNMPYLLKELKLDENYFIKFEERFGFETNQYVLFKKDSEDDAYNIKDVFPNKTQALFYLNYNNITKTEKLPFMTWEEFDKNYLGFEFSGKKGHQYRFWFNRDFKIQITDENLNKIEEWDANEENFYKAYAEMKKLFLGEQNERKENC